MKARASLRPLRKTFLRIWPAPKRRKRRRHAARIGGRKISRSKIKLELSGPWGHRYPERGASGGVEGASPHDVNRAASAVAAPFGRQTVRDLVPVSERVAPAGRLDYDSGGLLLLSNDGELVRTVTRAGHCSKVYVVKVKGEVAEADRLKLERGVSLEGQR